MSKKRGVGVAALIIAGIAVLGLAAAVYAKYFAEFQASGTAKIAKWNFEDENSSSTVTCQLTSTVQTGTIASGTPVIIAPGTSGECTLQLANNTSEVAVDYTVTVNETDSDVPTNLKLSSDGTTFGTLASFTKTGTIAAGAANAQTVTIYWQWPYETGAVANGIAAGDSDDTTDGEDAYDGQNTMTLAFDIKGVQHNPANAIAP